MTLPKPVLFSIIPLALGVGACVDDNADSGLTVLRAAAPEAGCTFADTSTAFVAAGRIQSDSSEGYVLAPQVRNDIVTNEGESTTRKTVFVDGIKVLIDFYDSNLFPAADVTEMQNTGLARFLAPVAGAVDPNGGRAVFPFEAVPAELIARIATRLPEVSAADPSPSTLLDVQIRLTGTQGGNGVESNLFHFPVEVCRNCITHDIGACADIPPGAVISTGGACGPLQDGILDCCTENGLQVCPARHPEM